MLASAGSARALAQVRAIEQARRRRVERRGRPCTHRGRQYASRPASLTKCTLKNDAGPIAAMSKRLEHLQHLQHRRCRPTTAAAFRTRDTRDTRRTPARARSTLYAARSRSVRSPGFLACRVAVSTMSRAMSPRRTLGRRRARSRAASLAYAGLRRTVSPAQRLAVGVVQVGPQARLREVALEAREPMQARRHREPVLGQRDRRLEEPRPRQAGRACGAPPRAVRTVPGTPTDLPPTTAS